MPRKVIREVEDQIDYKGDLPASKPVKGAGVAESPSTVFNGTTRKQDNLDTGNASNHSEDQRVLSLTQTTESEELTADDETGVVDNFPAQTEDQPSAGAVTNADTKSEERRNRLYHARVHKAESSAMRAIEAQKARVLAKKLKAEEARLDAEILKARESAKPRLAVASPKGGLASGKVSATEAEVSKPSAWLRAVQRNQNVSPAYVWSINKEKIFESYSKKGIRSFDGNDNEIISKVKGSEALLAGVTGPAESMRIMSEQVLVLPSGKVVTPIRQFCETKILPVGTKEAYFFDFGAVTFDNITETDDAIGTATPASNVVIRTAGTSTSPRGTRITIGYQQTEESPIDIIASANRAFALESINDESKQVMNAFNNDTAGSGTAGAVKAVGGGIKDGRWVRGDTGGALTTGAGANQGDNLTLGSLKYVGLLTAKGVIQDEGLDDTNLITYTSGKAIRDLTMDADLDTYIGYSKPAIITEATVERIAGTNLVRSSAIANGQIATQKRSVMFVPNVAFGLISGRDLTMEAQRRNELQAIHLTGTQKVAGLVKNVEATCRISHL